MSWPEAFAGVAIAALLVSPFLAIIYFEYRENESK